MLHSWCHVKLLPSRRVLCTPYKHASCHVISCKATNVFLLRTKFYRLFIYKSSQIISIFDVSLLCRTPGHYRFFFINKNYGGCAIDAGWLCAVSPHVSRTPCAWDDKPRYPVFLYSKAMSSTVWQSGSEYIVFSIAMFCIMCCP